jgi:hypothetical protein
MSTPKTAREALEQCQLLWRELLETGSDNKYEMAQDLFGYELQACMPACEYAMQVDKYDMCAACPVDAWRHPNLDCTSLGSPYLTWCYASVFTDKERGNAAIGILRLVRASLKNLEG